MSKKQQEEIENLKEELKYLGQDYQELVRAWNQKCNAEVRAYNDEHYPAPTIPTYTPPSVLTQVRQWWSKPPKYAADISLDIWPLKDWFRLSYSPWRPGRYTQLCVGPIRAEFFAA